MSRNLFGSSSTLTKEKDDYVRPCPTPDYTETVQGCGALSELFPSPTYNPQCGVHVINTINGILSLIIFQ